MRVSDKTIDGLTRDSVVPARAKLRGKAVVKQELAHDLGGDGNAEGHPRQLHGIAGDVDVTRGEDEGDNGDESDGRGACANQYEWSCVSTGAAAVLTWVVPGQELVEERVVVRQGLSGGSGVVRSLARGSEVVELIAGLSSVDLDVLRNGA